MINIHEPKISFGDKLKVLKALSTNWIGKGETVKLFEQSFANYLGVASVISTTSCTQALFEVFNYLKTITNKKQVVITSIGWIGIPAAIKLNGFDFVYCDISHEHNSMSFESLQKTITSDTVAVVVQHYGGRPNLEIEKIINLTKDKNIFVIEDCATVLGAKINNKHVGTFGDFAVWSFDAMKTITSGDGGMIFCSNKEHEKILRNNIFLGIDDNSSTFDKSKTSESWWVLEPKSFGTRNIMNNISASLGLSQLEQLSNFIQTQNRIWNYYLNNIKNHLIKLPQSTNVEEADYLFWIYSEKRDLLASYLKRNGIFSTFRYYPLHKTLLYFSSQSLPNTERFYSTALCIPCHKNLSEKQIDFIVSKINDFNPSCDIL